MKVWTADWKAVFAGSVQGVGVTATAARAPSRPSGLPAEGIPIPGCAHVHRPLAHGDGQHQGGQRPHQGFEVAGVARVELELVIIGQADGRLRVDVPGRVGLGPAGDGLAYARLDPDIESGD